MAPEQVEIIRFEIARASIKAEAQVQFLTTIVVIHVVVSMLVLWRLW